MDPLVFLSHLTTLLILALFRGSSTVNCTTFTFVNKCGDPVWPGILSNAGSVPLVSTGFELPSGASRSFPAPAGWSGRFWARTGCAFDPSTGRGACSTGDCGSGSVECGGAGAAPPATLAEFTLASPAPPAAPGQDFYDVSLVDGYNLPMAVVPSGGGGGGSSNCKVTGCAVDLNQRCPAELKAGGGTACRSACEAFGKPEDCCSGAYASPATCRPSVYSQMFKAACPRSYSYAFDDATSTFTCTNADYSITFCPDSTPSQKASTTTATDPTSPSTSTSKTTGEGEGEGEGEGVMLADDSWLANLATGASAPTRRRLPFLQQTPLLLVAILLIFFSLV